MLLELYLPINNGFIGVRRCKVPSDLTVSPINHDLYGSLNVTTSYIFLWPWSKQYFAGVPWFGCGSVMILDHRIIQIILPTLSKTLIQNIFIRYSYPELKWYWGNILKLHESSYGFNLKVLLFVFCPYCLLIQF